MEDCTRLNVAQHAQELRVQDSRISRDLKRHLFILRPQQPPDLFCVQPATVLPGTTYIHLPTVPIRMDCLSLYHYFSPLYFLFFPSTGDCLELHCKHRTAAERHGAMSGASPCLCLIFAGHFRSLWSGLAQVILVCENMSQLVLIFQCRTKIELQVATYGCGRSILLLNSTEFERTGMTRTTSAKHFQPP